MARETDPLAACRARVSALESALAEAQSKASRAREDLERAQAGVEQAKTKAGEAESAYSDEPTPGNERRYIEAADRVRLAEVRCKKPRERSVAADESVRCAVLAVEAARQDLADLERQQRIESLRVIAGVAWFTEQSRPHYRRLAAAYAELGAAAEQIDLLFNRSVGASKELRLEGVDCAEAEDLCAVHLCLGAMSPEADTRLLDNSILGPLWHAVAPTTLEPASLARAMCVPLLDKLQSAPQAEGDEVEAARAVRTTRGWGQREAEEIRRQGQLARAPKHEGKLTVVHHDGRREVVG